MANFSAELVLNTLKPFQRKTAEYVFQRFYGDGENQTKRFLVADEAGLGKTRVASGVIAMILESKEGTGTATVVVYICSNAAIAEQNLKQLTMDEEDTCLSTRLTLLSKHLSELQKEGQEGLKLISFTPGTTFDYAHHQTGHQEERLLLYHLLYHWLFSRYRNEKKKLQKGLKNLLRGSVDKEKWNCLTENTEYDEVTRDIAPDFIKNFIEKIREGIKKGDYADLKQCCMEFADERKKIRDESKRKILISKLRRDLALAVLSKFRPDLVILDEFQRFKDLTNEDEISQVAQEMFKQKELRVLLLSATPYKMYSLNKEKDDNHYGDFLDTLDFLFLRDTERLECVKELLKKNYHDELGNGITETKRAVEALLSVMCRTERVGCTHDRDAMLERKVEPLSLQKEDLYNAKAAYKLAGEVNAVDDRRLMEYWKSVPYLCSFMSGYEFMDKWEDRRGELATAVQELAPNTLFLKTEALDGKKEISAGNPRMRALFADTLDKDMWQLLWMPPSLPYIEPSGVYEGKEKLSKALVFSDWNAVPDAVSVLCSHEAERRMTKGKYRHDELYEKATAPLRFSLDKKKRPGSMPVLALMLPFPTLAREADPLRIAVRAGRALSCDEMREEVKKICSDLLERLPNPKGKRVDLRWYWAAPVLIEGQNPPDWKSLSEKLVRPNEDAGRAVKKEYRALNTHIETLLNIDAEHLGPRPEDLLDVLCDIALAAPGTCAFRALRRAPRTPDATDEKALFSAVKVADGFRTLFNIPENNVFLKEKGKAFWRSKEKGKAIWRSVLNYGIQGNIQAMLDEYVHTLNADPESCADEIKTVLSRSATQVYIEAWDGEAQRKKIKSRPARCRFALRFRNGESANQEEEGIIRADVVRKKFNSPFRPFILSSTSIGQEGLDFHTWCHAVMHWNLPDNPEELEQREGRVHRFKGYAVRKNVAQNGLGKLKEALNGAKEAVADGTRDRLDPWEKLFEIEAKKQKNTSGILPCWICEGDTKIEARVPLLPFSKDEEKYKRLTKDLTLYRLTYGQPRQEDLLRELADRFEKKGKELSSCFLSLVPPEVENKTSGRDALRPKECGKPTKNQRTSRTGKS